MTWTPDVATSSVFATLVLQSAVGAVVYIIFELLRGQREVFWPKRRSHPTRCPNKDLSGSIFSWIHPVLEISDDETLKLVGLDGFVLLRFLRLTAKLFLGCGAFALVFLLPIYSTGFGSSDVVGIDRYTIANVIPGGDRLWAPMLVTWIFSVLLLYLLYKEYEQFVTLRHQFLVEGDADMPTQQLYSATAENLPADYQSSAKLQEAFEELFPGQVLFAHVGFHTDAAVAAHEERKLCVYNLEKAIALYEAGNRTEKPMVSLHEGKVAMCRGTEKVDAISYYINEIRRLNRKIAAMKQKVASLDSASTLDPEAALNSTASSERIDADGEDPLALTATGYVTFRSKHAQCVASQVPVLTDQYPDLTLVAAPAPDNIIWRNVGVTLNEIRVASIVTSAMLYTGLMFWAVILAFISAISSLSNLEKYLPFLKELDPISYALLEGQLPVIALIVFISMLPVIFASVSIYVERRKTISDVRMEVFTWFFLYQIANVYLILLAGSIFGALTDAIDDPASIVSLLAKALPGVATFFLNFLLTLLLSGVPFTLLRIAPAVIYKLYRSCFNERKLTRRELVEGPLTEVTADYATLLPKFLYVFCIGVTYWVIAPIVVFVAGLLFAANYAVYKYQLCYVFVNKNETGGLFFYKLYNFSMTGLLASAVTMVVYLAIKEGEVVAPLLLPLPILIACVWRYTEEKFKTLSRGLSLAEALRVDSRSSKSDVTAGTSARADIATFRYDFFQHPVLRGNTDIFPEAYRIAPEGAEGKADLVPLVNDQGWLQEEYFASTTMTFEELTDRLGIVLDFPAGSSNFTQEKSPLGK